MKTLMFARKYLLELWRSPQLFWLFLLFPALMVLIYYSAFGQGGGMANFLTVVVDNQDQGPQGAGLVQALRAAEFDGKAAFTLLEGLSLGEAENLLNEGKAAALLTIPPGFSAALQTVPPQPLEIGLRGDPLSDTYAFVHSFVGAILRTFSDRATGWQQTLPLSLEFLPNTGTLNDFQVGVPGLIVFGIMFGVITNALLLTRERSDGTLKRIQLSRARAVHFLGGVTLTGMALTLAQMLITFAVAAAVGFQPVGSLWLAIGIGVVASLGAVGAGFMAACFSKTEGEATAYGTAWMVPLVFLSGAVFPMPFWEWFRLGSQAVQPYDIFSATHAAAALSKVLLYGAGLDGLVYELGMLGLLSLLSLGVGVGLYQRMVLDRP